MRIAHVHRFADNNIGDLLSCPGNYFYDGARYDILKDKPRKLDVDILIVGGGGMFRPKGWTERIGQWVELNPHVKRVAWGVDKDVVPEWFHLYGTRETTPFLPCPSCMHPGIKIQEGEGVAAISHFRDKIPAKVDNRVRGFDYLKYMREAAKIETTSWHIAYWGYLMQKEVDVKISGGKYEYLGPVDLEEHRELTQQFANEVYS